MVLGDSQGWVSDVYTVWSWASHLTFVSLWFVLYGAK